MKTKTIQMSMGRDMNGNKIVKLSFPNGLTKSAKAFSIQTNGNLPNTHRNNKPDRMEIFAFISRYGTNRQKAIIEKYAC